MYDDSENRANMPRLLFFTSRLIKASQPKFIFILQATGAAALTAILSSIIQSVDTLSYIKKLGMSVEPSIFINTIFQDMVRMGPAYGIVILIAFIIAFPTARFLQRFIPLPLSLVYPIAGGAAAVVALSIMTMILQITPISSARETLGFLLHGLAGVIGGKLYFRLTDFKRPSQRSSF